MLNILISDNNNVQYKIICYRVTVGIEKFYIGYLYSRLNTLNTAKFQISNYLEFFSNMRANDKVDKLKSTNEY